jgi:hypothetical protein
LKQEEINHEDHTQYYIQNTKKKKDPNHIGEHTKQEEIKE